MNTNAESIHSISLEPLLIKDIGQFKRVVAHIFPTRTDGEWRKIMRNKRAAGEQLYVLQRDGAACGGVSITSPFGSPTWRIARIHTIGPLPYEEKKMIARQIAQTDELIYRIDIAHIALSEADMKAYSKLTGVDWPQQRDSFFSPQVSAWQVAFIPWEFGYLAVTTTDDRTKIAALEFVRGGSEELTLRVKQSAYYFGYLNFEGKIAVPENPVPEEECDVLQLARQELRQYLSGGHELQIPFQFPEGTPFQRQVWEKTLTIPYGTVKTYADIAEMIQPDKEKAGQMARAVGRALGANPLPIIIPCHRVIGSNQTLTGFGGGLDVKDYLLQLEMWHSLSSSS